MNLRKTTIHLIYTSNIYGNKPSTFKEALGVPKIK